MIKELAEKFEHLTASYQKLCECYEQIASYGSEEETLIVQGKMELLLEILRDKEKLMLTVGQAQEEVRKVQKFLTDYYELESFSLPQILGLLNERDQHYVHSLQKEISKLISVLEALESQEKRHEQMLQQYTRKPQAPLTSITDHKAAKEAYRRFVKPNPNGPSIEK